jgi:hypothetical protein
VRVTLLFASLSNHSISARILKRVALFEAEAARRGNPTTFRRDACSPGKALLPKHATAHAKSLHSSSPGRRKPMFLSGKTQQRARRSRYAYQVILTHSICCNFSRIAYALKRGTICPKGFYLTLTSSKRTARDFLTFRTLGCSHRPNARPRVFQYIY